MTPDQVRQIVQEEIKKAAQQAQYTVTRVPVHSHNSIDSPTLNPTAVQGFTPLPSNTTPTASAGVLGLLAGQTVGGPPNTNASFNPPSVVVYPIPIIYGYGVGVHSAFNGGEAPQGTVLFFENGLTLSKLFIKTANGWYGISPDVVQ